MNSIQLMMPLMVFIPIGILFIIGKVIFSHIDNIREMIYDENSIINNGTYQLGVLGLILAIIYMLTSFVLSGFIIWTYKPKLIYPYENISNRGGRITFPGNTIEAFKRALKNGAQVILMDVQLTKDKKVVVLQDEDLSKINGKSSKIRYLNYIELPTLKLNSEQLELKENQKINEKQLEIPLLEKVLKEFPETPFIINLNADSMELADEVNKLIRKNEREKITIWGSFKHEKIGKYLFEINKAVPVFFSKSTIRRLVFYDFIGLLPFIKLNESVYISTQRTNDNKGYSLLKPGLDMHLNSRGIPVIAYSDIIGEMDDINVIERIRKLRINGIVADDSKNLTEYLEYIVEQKRKELEEKNNKNNKNLRIEENENKAIMEEKGKDKTKEEKKND